MSSRYSPRLALVAGWLVLSVLATSACSGDGSAVDGPQNTGATLSPTTVPAATAPLVPTPTATAAPTPEPADAPSFTVVATGDLLLHERLWAQARRDARTTGQGTLDFVPQLAAIAPVTIAASLALCHLETPLAPKAGPYEGYPTFSSPPQIADALVSLGYDACSTASNHTFDKGSAGIERTLDRLDAVGIAHSGSARSQAESRVPRIIQVTASEGSTVRVGLLSFTYGFNGIPYPGGDEWRSNVIDLDAIRAGAAAARAAGAEVVVLSMHWGSEYQQKPNEQQLTLAKQISKIDDIDLVIGHHAHVVQPVEQVRSTWVAYGHGNLIAAHRTPGEPNAEGLLTRWTFTGDPERPGRFIVSDAEYLPLIVTDEIPVRVLNVPLALASGEYGSSSRSRLGRAQERTTDVVESRGGAKDGLRPLQAD